MRTKKKPTPEAAQHKLYKCKPNPIKDICYVACVVSVIGWGFSYIGFRFDSFNLVPPGGWGPGSRVWQLLIVCTHGVPRPAPGAVRV